MRIILLTEVHAGAFKAIRIEAITECPASFVPTLEEENAKTAENFRDEIINNETSWVLGAFFGETLVGIVGLKREVGSKIRHTANIWGVYVAKESRQQGLGKQLLIKALELADHLPGLLQIKLRVHPANVAARRLYESCGFRCVGTDPRVLYFDGVFYHEELMMLSLDSHFRPELASPPT